MPLDVIDSGVHDRDSTGTTASVTIPYTFTDANATAMVIGCAAQNVDNPIDSVTVDGVSVPFDQHSAALYATLDGCTLLLDLSGTTPALSGDIVITWAGALSSKMGAYAWVTLGSRATFHAELIATNGDGSITKTPQPFTSLIVACRYTYSTGGATITSPTASLEISNTADGGRRLVDMWTADGEFQYDFVKGYEGGAYVAIFNPLVFTDQTWPKGGNIYAPV